MFANEDNHLHRFMIRTRQIESNSFMN